MMRIRFEQHGGTFVGFVAGLVLGLAVALAVAVYVVSFVEGVGAADGVSAVGWCDTGPGCGWPGRPR